MAIKIKAAVLYNGIMGVGINHGFALLNLLDSNPNLVLDHEEDVEDGFLINGKFHDRSETDHRLGFCESQLISMAFGTNDVRARDGTKDMDGFELSREEIRERKEKEYEKE